MNKYESQVVETLETILISNQITKKRRIKNQTDKLIEVASHLTFTGDISAPNIYTKTEVHQLLTNATTSYDITSAISWEADTSTTYTKPCKTLFAAK